MIQDAGLSVGCDLSELLGLISSIHGLLMSQSVRVKSVAEKCHVSRFESLTPCCELTSCEITIKTFVTQTTASVL